MDQTHENYLDPIPSEESCEIRPAEKGKPAGMRILAFNTVVDIEAFGTEDDCTEAFEEARKLCRIYERLFSRTLPHSDVARINEAAGAPVVIDSRTFEVLKAGLHFCAASEGTFDITLGPVVKLWDFRQGIVPEADALSEAVRHVDWHKLKLGTKVNLGGTLYQDIQRGSANSSFDEATNNAATHPTLEYWAQLEDPQAAIDMGGIAKGWIADRLIEACKNHGLSGIIVNLGGNVAVAGTKPDGSPWRVGIRDPRQPEKLIGAVPLAQGSTVTSGTYERSFTSPDGAFYHHILDPQTGMPVKTDIAGVSVIAKKSLDAEGFSTTLLALGIERGKALVCHHPEISQAFFIDKEGRITAARQ